MHMYITTYQMDRELSVLMMMMMMMMMKEHYRKNYYNKFPYSNIEKNAFLLHYFHKVLRCSDIVERNAITQL